MRIAFIIGHTRLKKGAFSKYFGMPEYDFWKQYQPLLEAYGDVFYHNPLIYGYNSRQRAMAKKTAKYDVVFELHFNSLDGSVNGCEAWYYYLNNKTMAIADKFCREYTKFSGTNNRGAKALEFSRQRGFGFVYYQKPNAILLEPFFGDNAKDCANFNINNFLRAVINSIK